MKKIYTAPNILVILLISISIAHCQKAKEELARNFVIRVMTDGRWIVNKFTENGGDSTALFQPFEFQFLANGTVYAIDNNRQISGTWEGNATQMTIVSNFPTGGDTLRLVSDTFKIFNNTPTQVEARPLDTSRDAYLKLVKK